MATKLNKNYWLYYSGKIFGELKMWTKWRIKKLCTTKVFDKKIHWKELEGGGGLNCFCGAACKKSKLYFSISRQKVVLLKKFFFFISFFQGTNAFCSQAKLVWLSQEREKLKAFLFALLNLMLIIHFTTRPLQTRSSDLKANSIVWM